MISKILLPMYKYLSAVNEPKNIHPPMEEFLAGANLLQAYSQGRALCVLGLLKVNIFLILLNNTYSARENQIKPCGSQSDTKSPPYRKIAFAFTMKYTSISTSYRRRMVLVFNNCFPSENVFGNTDRHAHIHIILTTISRRVYPL